MSSAIHFLTKHGEEIEEVFDDLAALRMTVFREFPYLYEGSFSYEKTYLKRYAQSERAMLLAIYNGHQLVGATTCLPLADEVTDLQAPFLANGYDPNEIFYFGESLLLPAFRGMGLGHRFFDAREAHARQFGHYRMTAFCAVERPADHPARPSAHRPHDGFWHRRGYRKNPDLRTTLHWPDLGETESTPKQMVFWMKDGVRSAV